MELREIKEIAIEGTIRYSKIDNHVIARAAAIEADTLDRVINLFRSGTYISTESLKDKVNKEQQTQ